MTREEIIRVGKESFDKVIIEMIKSYANAFKIYQPTDDEFYKWGCKILKEMNKPNTCSISCKCQCQKDKK